MRSIAMGTLLALALVPMTAVTAEESTDGGSPAEGFWQGAIHTGSSKISVEVHLTAAVEGGLAGEISFPSQGEYGIGLAIYPTEGDSVHFGLPDVPGQPLFEGTLGEGGDRIAGTYLQSGRSYPFELVRGEAPRPAAPVSSAVRAQLVESIAAQLIEGYIYEDAGKRIAEGLRAAADAGEIAEGLTAPALAIALTEKLGELSNDIHLRVQYRGDSGGEEASETHDAEPASDESGAPGSGGIGDHQIFEGNIGYLNMVHFGGGDTAAAELDKVMAELAGVSGLVIDLRENLGGGPFMVRYLSTYLFDEPTHLASRVGRQLSEPAERWTFETTRGERLADVPVVLLISGTTVSAGESFAFGLRNNNRVTIFGERTAGGGHFGDMVDLGEGFSMFLPVGKTINPETGEGWEAEGLAPDQEMRAEYALEAALDYLKSSS
jgi:hypothetical protein